MSAPDGTPTHAAYGFANTLLKYLAETEATHAAVAFDFSDRSFRNAIEPGYKAQRGETPDDLAPQFEICMQVARALGLGVFAEPEFEADDLIATLAEGLLAQRASAVIVTTDKDLAQLVREDGRVVLYDLARGKKRDADAVRARFGVDPEQIADYLGLVGDAVDNLPGVPGVGAKTAAAALRRFGRIEAIPADAAAWSDAGVRGAASAAARIEAHRERALLTRELATLRRDVPGVAGELAGLCWRGADRAAIEPLFARLGWGKIATRIPRWA